MCLSSTQPLHSAASGIVGKLHRLFKNRTGSHTAGHFSPGEEEEEEEEEDKEEGGHVAQGTFHVENKPWIKTAKDNDRGSSSPVPLWNGNMLFSQSLCTAVLQRCVFYI